MKPPYIFHLGFPTRREYEATTSSSLPGTPWFKFHMFNPKFQVSGDPFHDLSLDKSSLVFLSEVRPKFGIKISRPSQPSPQNIAAPRGVQRFSGPQELPEVGVGHGPARRRLRLRGRNRGRCSLERWIFHFQ